MGYGLWAMGALCVPSCRIVKPMFQSLASTASDGTIGHGQARYCRARIRWADGACSRTPARWDRGCAGLAVTVLYGPDRRAHCLRSRTDGHARGSRKARWVSWFHFWARSGSSGHSALDLPPVIVSGASDTAGSATAGRTQTARTTRIDGPWREDRPRPTGPTGDGQVLSALLNNPRLVENDILVILNTSEPPPDFFGELASHRKWGSYIQVRRALVACPHTPLPLALSVLVQLSVTELRRVLEHPDLSEKVREAAQSLVEREASGQRRVINFSGDDSDGGGAQPPEGFR